MSRPQDFPNCYLMKIEENCLLGQGTFEVLSKIFIIFLTVFYLKTLNFKSQEFLYDYFEFFLIILCKKFTPELFQFQSQKWFLQF